MKFQCDRLHLGHWTLCTSHLLHRTFTHSRARFSMAVDKLPDVKRLRLEGDETSVHRREEKGHDEEDDDDGQLHAQDMTSAPNASEKRRHRGLLFKRWTTQEAKKETSSGQRKQGPGAEREDQLPIRDLIANYEKTKEITDAREYQLELFEIAKSRNTIAVLDTGTGKTFIAVLLLRHLMDEELESRSKARPRRTAFFLVCFPHSLETAC